LNDRGERSTAKKERKQFSCGNRKEKESSPGEEKQTSLEGRGDQLNPNTPKTTRKALLGWPDRAIGREGKRIEVPRALVWGEGEKKANQSELRALGNRIPQSGDGASILSQKERRE